MASVAGADKASLVKRIDVFSVGLTMSDRLLVGAFLDLVALADGHVFRLCEHRDAAIVLVNPADVQAVALLQHPQAGVAYIQYGMPESIFSRDVWRLGAPVRLTALRDILIGIVALRREWKSSGVLVPGAQVDTDRAALPVPAHRKLEHVLGVLDAAVHSRIPHALCGVPGVEIVVFPDRSAVYIHCEPDISAWQQALVNTQRPIAALSRIGARPTLGIQPISVAHFRWELARHLSAGMLLPGLASRLEFGLTRWPDFGTMTAGSAFDLRIVALITTRPSSIANILRAVPYTREGIVALLNGCALVGCMRDAPADLLHRADAQRQLSVQTGVRATAAASQTPAAVPTPTPRRGFAGVLSKLRAALSFVPRANT